MPAQSAIDLIAIASDGSELQFDGTLFAPGVHLRWGSLPSLGWPVGGYEIRRRFWGIDEFRQFSASPWKSLRTISLPMSEAEEVSRAATITTGSRIASYQSDAASLTTLVREVALGPSRMVSAPRGATRISISALDLLHVAALDPYIARAVGLAFVDGTVPASMPVDYQVFGHWGAAPWPWTNVRFADLSPGDLGRGLIQQADLIGSTGRKVTVTPMTGGALALTLSGISGLGLRLQFSKPMRELEVTLSLPTALIAASTWRVVAWNSRGAIPPSRLSVAASGSTLRITSPDDQTIDEIELTDAAGAAPTTWRLTAVRYRARTGTIGTQMSRIVCISHQAGARVDDLHFDAPWPTPPVALPSGARINIEETDRNFLDDGRAGLATAEARVFFGAPVAPDRPDLGQAVRVHSVYIRTAGMGAPTRAEYLTMPTSIPGRTLAMRAFWRLDGAPTSVTTGPALVPRGSVQYVPDRSAWLGGSGLVDQRRATLFLTGRVDARDGVGARPGLLECPDTSFVEGATEFQVQLWVFPIQDAEPFPSLVGNDFRRSFGLGLVRAGSTLKIRFRLRDGIFESTGSIPLTTWSHVAVRYDSHQVLIYIGGVLDSAHAAVLGPVAANPRGTLCIGCDPQSAKEPFAFPFAGCLADVQILRGVPSTTSPQHLLAAYAFDNDFRDRRGGPACTPIGPVSFEAGHPEIASRRSLRLNGTACASIVGSPLADPGRKLCIKLNVKPDVGQPAAVLLGAPGWQLSLRPVADAYQVALSINGSTATSPTLSMPAARWSELIVSADGREAVFYVNARPASGRLKLDYGRIAGDPSGSVVVGAGASSRPGALVAPFRGLLADLEVSDALPASASPYVLTAGNNGTETADVVVRNLGPGTYRFVHQGVDVFGRVGALVTSAPLVVTDTFRPPRPGGARARFLPIIGELTAVTPPSNGRPHFNVTMRLTRPAAMDGFVAADLMRHDAEVAQVTVDPADVQRRKIERSETYEIARPELADSRLSLEFLAPSLPRLRAAAGQHVTIAHDRWARSEWTWTGMQRLFAPDVDRFELTERRLVKAPQTWSGWRPLGAAIALPIAHGDVVTASPAYAPLRVDPLEYAEWEALRDEAGVVSLPEPAGGPEAPVPAEDPPAARRRPRSRIWRVAMPTRTALASSRVRLDPTQMPANAFVAGALVAYNAAPAVRDWQIYTVLWHEWNPASGWLLYFVENSRGREPVAAVAPELSHARYYPGQRYRVDAQLGEPIQFVDLDGQPLPTVAIEIAVRAVARNGRRSLVGKEREPGVDPTPPTPRTAGAAQLVAVDRRRPALPPPPTVVIDRADYYGVSRAEVTWAHDASVTYQVYRATDNAIFLRDSTQRRLGTGIYQGRAPAERLSDDPDFSVWLAARWSDWTTGWETRLFVPKPRDESDPAMAAWKAASEVWHEWGARFYPAHPELVTDIAARAGNEEAFALVNASPVSGGAFADALNGAVRNRYLYRLRSQSAALLRSTVWGPVSEPTVAPATRSPTAPVLIGIEAGDRSVSLRWTHSPESNVVHYLLYRAETADELADLRFWVNDGPKRAARPIADPRLKVRNGAVVVTAPDLTEVVAVYRLDEAQTTNLGRQPFDYRAGSNAPVPGEPGQHRIALRAIVERTPVLVVYRDAGGTDHSVGDVRAGVRHVDDDLIGLTDYHYAVVAVDENGNRSVGSAPLRARAYEAGVPAAAAWSATARAAGGDAAGLAWACAYPQQCLLLRRRTGASYHEVRSDWQSGAFDGTRRAWVFTANDADLDPAITYEYWVIGRTVGGHRTESPRISL